MDPMSLWAVSTIVVVVTTLLVLLRMRTKSSPSSSTQWPSGPKTLPIIGNLHQLGGDVLHVVLAKLAKVHGNIMTIWIGSWRPVIVISDYDKAWEVLVNKSSDYSARDMPEITKIASAGWRNISSSNSGPFWHSLRKGLQNGPLGPLNISAQIFSQERDMKRMIHDMQEEAAMNGGIVKPLDHLKKASVRLLNRLIFGQNFDDDSFVESIHHETEELIRISGYARLAEAFSYAKYLPSHRRAVKEAYEGKQRVEELVRPLLSSNPPPNSFLHFLMSQDYPEEVIICCILEIYLLGVDSTSSTTTWALAFLVHNQTVQEKLYQAIKCVIDGDGGLVKTGDLSKLHYLQAVMKEAMRMKPIAPLAIPHTASKDTTLMGTKVAKGTRVMVNLYSLHHNPNIWTEPFKFMPERFLQEEFNGGSGGGGGDANVKAMEKSFLPFSAGMRICAGMDLGKLQFSFALANLVNTFKWTSVADGKLPDMSEELSLVLLMKTPLEARIVPRNP
nr:putative CYP719 [synthetic construct]